MSYDTNLPNAIHFHRGKYAGANGAIMSRIMFPYPVKIRSLHSIVTTAHDTAGCGWTLRTAAGTEITGTPVVHGTGAAGTKVHVTGLAVDVDADTEVQIYGIADSEVGVQEICICYEVKAGQNPR